MAAESYRVSVDVGGTFTDFQILDEVSGAMHEFKVATTPDDPSRGFVEGLKWIAAQHGFPLSQTKIAMHGTTIATNALLEHKLPRGALLTTAGFTDVFEIGRHLRRHIYGLKSEPRYVMIPRTLRFAVRERITAMGTIAEPLDIDGARRVAMRLKMQNVDCIAICLLNAYANPAHELLLRDVISSVMPEAHISLSSDISPEIREYERMSTTVLNVLLMPVVQSYLARLKSRLSEGSLRARLFVLQSNGGVAGPENAGLYPARLLLSGPCGGSIAAERLSERLAEPNLVAVDMGGTSFDVSVVRGGKTATVAETAIEGFPVRLPMVEIRTIGTGGGSIAWLDAGNRLRVGPQSAGAHPGPACYSRGGMLPTVTDANLVLGRIDESRFLDGGMRLDAKHSTDAIQEQIASPLGLDLTAAAEGILAVTNAQLAAAVRLSLFEKGLDPRDFALVAFGGAGGLHGAQVADGLGINRVVFPRGAGTFSAYGILWSDIIHDVSRSLPRPLGPEIVNELDGVVSDLVAEAQHLLDEDQIPAGQRRIELAMDLRYRGQGFELTIPWPEARVTRDGLAVGCERFHETHLLRFSHNSPLAPLELVTVRVSGRGILPKPSLPMPTWDEASPPPTKRRVFLDGRWQMVSAIERTVITPGSPIEGPALISEEFSTILLPEAWELGADPGGDLIGRRLGS